MPLGLRNPPKPDYLSLRVPFSFTSDQTMSGSTVGRVYLARIEFAQSVVVTAINIFNGMQVAGNVTVGIYAEGAADTPAGGAVLAEAATAQAGASGVQSIALTPTPLPAGAYYVAIEMSDGLGTTGRSSGNSGLFMVNGKCYYDRAGGYGALTDPCPAITDGTIAEGINSCVRVQV